MDQVVMYVGYSAVVLTLIDIVCRVNGVAPFFKVGIPVFSKRIPLKAPCSEESIPSFLKGIAEWLDVHKLRSGQYGFMWKLSRGRTHCFTVHGHVSVDQSTREIVVILFANVFTLFTVLLLAAGLAQSSLQGVSPSGPFIAFSVIYVVNCAITVNYLRVVDRSLENALSKSSQ